MLKPYYSLQILRDLIPCGRDFFHTILHIPHNPQHPHGNLKKPTRRKKRALATKF